VLSGVGMKSSRAGEVASSCAGRDSGGESVTGGACACIGSGTGTGAGAGACWKVYGSG
jgi:hypothetical protein